MSKRETFARYGLIINKLKRKPASFDEIETYLDHESEIQSYHYTISKRTFQRDVHEILSLFDIDIQFDKTKKVYYISDSGKMESNDRILDAFNLFNTLNLANGLSDFMHFETRKPLGLNSMKGLLHAIRNGIVITFNYTKYWEEESTTRSIQPYALKEFNHRWYLLGKSESDKIVKTFALDRITELEFTQQKFTAPVDYNVEDKFRYSFGIINHSHDNPAQIELSFSAFQGKYIKSMPLHQSQEVVIDNEDELRIKLSLWITHDFIMELLSYGSEVKVLAPQVLIDEIKTKHLNAFTQYEK